MLGTFEIKISTILFYNNGCSFSMLVLIVVAMVSIEAHLPLPLSGGVLFPLRWAVALARKLLMPKQPKYD